MRNESHFCRALDHSGFLRSEFRHHGFESGSVISFFQVALQFALGPAMLQSSAIEPDAFNKTLGMARFIRGIVKGILERRRTDVDDENFLGPLALAREPVRI